MSPATHHDPRSIITPDAFDQLLRVKLNGSGLESYLEIQATVGEEERRLLTDFEL
jgi:hypothetical protein